MNKQVVIKMESQWIHGVREFIDGEKLYCQGDDWDPIMVEIDNNEWEFMQKAQ